MDTRFDELNNKLQEGTRVTNPKKWGAPKKLDFFGGTSLS